MDGGVTSSSLAIVQGALGDTVLLAPALVALAQAAPPLEVWGPSRERLLPLLAPLGPAAAVRAFPPEALPLWGPGPLPAALEARLRRLARLVAFGGPGALADRVAALGGAAVAAPGAGAVFDGHALELIAAHFQAATGLPVEGPPALHPDDALRARGRALGGAPAYAVLHPGAGAREKRWPLPHFLELAAATPLPCVLVTGPAELEWPVEWPREGPPCPLPARGVRRLGPLPLLDLVALLAGARAFAGNDAGPSHLAAALGVPTLAVFGPTDPAAWAPRGRAPVRVVRGDLASLSAPEVLPAWAVIVGL